MNLPDAAVCQYFDIAVKGDIRRKVGTGDS
jgi:hypothetical protein